MRHAAHRLISKATCVHMLTVFCTEDLSNLYHQRWRKGKENWMKTDKWKCIPSSLTICQLHFLLFGFKLLDNISLLHPKTPTSQDMVCFFVLDDNWMLIIVTLSFNPYKQACRCPPLASSTSDTPLYPCGTPPQSCVWVHLSTIPSSEAMRGGVESQITPSCQFWKAERESGLAMLEVGCAPLHL